MELKIEENLSALHAHELITLVFRKAVCFFHTFATLSRLPLGGCVGKGVSSLLKRKLLLTVRGEFESWLLVHFVRTGRKGRQKERLHPSQFGYHFEMLDPLF